MASAVREITVACSKCEYYQDGSCLKPIDLGCGTNEDLLLSCDAIYEKAVSDIHSSIAMVKEMIEKKKISKTAGEELLFNMNGALSSLVGGGKEFYKKQAKQEVQDIVVEAKRHVQSYVDNKIYSIGLQMLKDGFESPQFIEREKGETANED